MRRFEKFIHMLPDVGKLEWAPVADGEENHVLEVYQLIFYALYDFYLEHPSLQVRAKNPEFKIYKDYLFYQAWSSFLKGGAEGREYDPQEIWENTTGACGGVKPSSPSWNQAVMQMTGLVAEYMDGDISDSDE